MSSSRKSCNFTVDVRQCETLHQTAGKNNIDVLSRKVWCKNRPVAKGVDVLLSRVGRRVAALSPAQREGVEVFTLPEQPATHASAYHFCTSTQDVPPVQETFIFPKVWPIDTEPTQTVKDMWPGEGQTLITRRESERGNSARDTHFQKTRPSWRLNTEAASLTIK